MKVKNSVEQAICLLIIIAHSNDEKPLKSYNISDSLSRKPDKITLLDIFEAIEGKEPFAKATGLVERVFVNELKEIMDQKQAMILDAFNAAEASYKEKLKTITLKMAMVERKKDS